MQETQTGDFHKSQLSAITFVACAVGSLGQEDPLEKAMATHSSILAWEIPWTEEPVGSQKSQPQLSD